MMIVLVLSLFTSVVLAFLFLISSVRATVNQDHDLPPRTKHSCLHLIVTNKIYSSPTELEILSVIQIGI